MILIIILALIFLFLLKLNVNLEERNHIIQSLIAFLTFGVLYFQYKHDRLMEKFTIFPNVTFYLISGRTHFFKQTQRHVSEFLNIAPAKFSDNLDTRFLVLNHSKFPIVFRLEIQLKIENENGETKLISSRKHEWHFDPGEIMNGHDSGQMLHKDILGNGYNENINLEEFKQKIRESKIKNISATTKFFCSPHASKKVILKGIPKTWKFDLKELIWIAPKGIKDYLISIKGYY